MLVVRPVRREDFKDLECCANTTGIGITHLPKKRELLEKKLQNSIIAFDKDLSAPQDEEYLFVLYDNEKQCVGGTSGIYASTGKPDLLLVFSIETMSPLPKALPTPKETRQLHLKSYQGGPTEICALYLLPSYRHGGWGRLLSLCRFLFIAAFPERFKETIIANMRGIIENDDAPFWNGLGRHFLDLDFPSVMKLRLERETLAEEIFPSYPIPVSFLTPETQQVIGKIHSHSQPALNMLAQQGFHFINEIDPFDGGPLVGTKAKEILAIKNGRLATVGKLIPTHSKVKQTSIISNNKLDFRACLDSIQINPDDSITLSIETAKGLEVEIGDQIRYLL